MGGRHQEGPEDETDLTGPHADAHAVAMTIELMVDRPADQQETCAGEKQAPVYEGARRDHRARDNRDRQRVPERDRRQRPEDGDPAPAMETERDGEQPPHCRIESVEGTEPSQREPGPKLRHSGRAPSSGRGSSLWAYG